MRAGRSLSDVLEKTPPEARAGTQALSFQVMRWLGGALAVRALTAPKPPPPWVDALLLSALALMWPGAGAPYADHTLVDQAVAAVRKRSPASAGFVNAVLRRFLRERDSLVEAARRDPQALWFHPPWWIERVRADWPEPWQAVLQAGQQHPPMTLRVNTRRTTVAAAAARLAEAGVESLPVGESGLQLAVPRPVLSLPGFAEGELSVQDLSAQRAALLLVGANASQPALQAGARVLDACAAPGGKTAHLLELAEFDLLALDSDASRLRKVQDTLDRLQLKARLATGDARQPPSWWDGQPFDAILLDAPCSASGIVRRHPDVRWLRRSADIDALAEIQAEMLDALWPLLAPGGRLLYCTCSVFRAEGQHQIDAFLQRTTASPPLVDPGSPGHLLPLADNDPKAPAVVADTGDGFFYSLLLKP